MHKFTPKYKVEPVDEVIQHNQTMQPDLLAKWVNFYEHYITLGKDKRYIQQKFSRKGIRGPEFQAVQAEIFKKYRWDSDKKAWIILQST